MQDARKADSIDFGPELLESRVLLTGAIYVDTLAESSKDTNPPKSSKERQRTAPWKNPVHCVS